MRHDHHEFHGPPAAPVAPGDTHPRTPAGRFTGPGCVPVASPPEAPDFTATDAAATVLTDQIDRALRTLLTSGWDPDSKTPAPVVALKASPGAGKSRATRARLARIPGLGGDIVWHARPWRWPTRRRLMPAALAPAMVPARSSCRGLPLARSIMLSWCGKSTCPGCSDLPSHL